MIKIGNSTLPEAPFRALQPDRAPWPSAETFALDGLQTSVCASPPAPQPVRFHFDPADDQLELSDRRGRFAEAERDNILCLLASPDARFGSLRLNAAAQIYTSQLGAGHQITYRIKPGHHLWLSLLSGRLELNQKAVGENHHASISDEQLLTISALSDSELLLIDLD